MFDTYVRIAPPFLGGVVFFAQYFNVETESPESFGDTQDLRYSRGTATSIGSLNLTYDPSGNLQDRSDNIFHTFDYRNRLTQIYMTAGGDGPLGPDFPDFGTTLTYTYDPSDSRITSTIQSGASAPATTTHSTFGRYNRYCFFRQI